MRKKTTSPNLILRGAIWHYRFTKNGQLYRGTTGHSDVRKAREVLSEKQSDVRDGADISPKAATTVGQWLDTNPHHKAGKMASSIERDEKALDRMRQEWAHRRMRDIRLTDCERLMRLREADVKLSTLERDRVVWKAAFEAAVDNGVITVNPWKKVKTLAKLLVPRDRVVTHDEERLLREHLEPSMQRLVTVALGTGLRIGELVTLRPVDVVDGYIRVRAEVSKGRKPRRIGVRAEVAEALTAQTPSAPDQPYWPLPTQAVRERLADASRAAEIPRVFPHALRHTFATRCAEKGLPLVMLQRLLGHSSPVVTARVYTHIEDRTRTDALLALAL